MTASDCDVESSTQPARKEIFGQTGTGEKATPFSPSAQYLGNAAHRLLLDDSPWRLSLRTTTMVWPFSRSDSSKDKSSKRRPISWADSLNGTDWQHFKDPRNWIPTVLVTTTVLASLHVYRSYLRRIPGPGYVKPGSFRKRSIFGQVTSVGDGDNFHMFHTPGGRLAGWGWLRNVPNKKADLKNKTVSSVHNVT